MTFTPIIDLRSKFGPARDQGERPTCLAFSASDLHAGLRDAWVPLSCDYVFYHAQSRAKRALHEGALLNEMLAAIREDGQPPETVWPYLSQLPKDTTNWKPPENARPLYRRAGEIGGDSFLEVVNALNEGNPALMLLKLSNSFFTVGKEGVVDEAPGEVPDVHCRHAVVAVGYGKSLTHQKAILIRNSWGDGWGDQGYAWLTERFVKPRAFRLAFLKEEIDVSTNSASA